MRCKWRTVKRTVKQLIIWQMYGIYGTVRKLGVVLSWDPGVHKAIFLQLVELVEHLNMCLWIKM